ncbi:type VI secretion system contractile sheath small subunit [Photorhabdus akhurstii]|uniref:hypothetical protein n=1 Tax=Photorhabdus akhurstii TaxID=171438 RepID=UPI00052B7089|nr:hypothetical protein KS18_10010 [Photorhabdus luminescens]PQQ34020.1 hypothetical protein C6H69_07390 [Photorhabdus luminescens]PQQ41561.1 hypothetical protein C6H65_08700 [Photorhabdus luminescens]
MFESFMNEVPKVHVNIKRSFHTGSTQKKVEWPLRLLFLSDSSYGQTTYLLSVNGGKENITLTFRDLKSNLLDKAMFCKEQETILKVPTPSDDLHKAVKANLLYTTLKTRPKINITT